MTPKDLTFAYLSSVIGYFFFLLTSEKRAAGRAALLFWASEPMGKLALWPKTIYDGPSGSAPVAH